MSKSNGWIPLDKNLKSCLPKDRPYTKLEAMFSHQLDVDNEIKFSINGYANLWQWSRNKVRAFVDNIRKDKGHPNGQVRDRRRTGEGQAVHLIILDLQKPIDTLGTGKGQLRDTPMDTTIKTKRKTKNKEYAQKKARANGTWKNSKDPMTSDLFIKLLLKDKRRHINLIAEYADEQKVYFKTKGQWHEFITRNLRYATKLAPFDDNQISNAMKQVKAAGYLEKYTLETLHKFLVK